MIIIQARNKDNNNRHSGADEFVIKIRKIVEEELKEVE
jgi:hypothetical protein